ncbi:hypothetical protein ACLI09_15650 [Flavobacterium sp. RHBU_24]|uniref:hypothetical protein n=1 Tax=Flavobacterium sp. RHBU_24 TaxID=3391185 RepID=UPI0039852AEC
MVLQSSPQKLKDPCAPEMIASGEEVNGALCTSTSRRQGRGEVRNDMLIVELNLLLVISSGSEFLSFVVSLQE